MTGTVELSFAQLRPSPEDRSVLSLEPGWSDLGHVGDFGLLLDTL